MDVSIMVEGQMGLGWARWKRLVPEVERLGYHGLYRSDHFVNPGPPDEDSLEMVSSLTWLADHTDRIRFGPLVAPVSVRDPVMLARQAAALQELSGGRFVLGLGAGWMAREHETFGYDLGDLDRRFARLGEAWEVVTALLRSDEPVTFEGRFYRLRDARILPRRQPPLFLAGGSGIRRTIPLAARHADVWNGVYLSPEKFRQRCERLDELLTEHGRKPSEVKRTMMLGCYVARDEDTIEPKLARIRLNPALAGAPQEEVLESLRARGVVCGTPAAARTQLEGLAAAGAEEVMLQWFDLDDLDGLAALAEGVL